MSKRRLKTTSTRVVIAMWVAAAFSAGLVYLTANAFVSTLKMFRSCDSNNTGLVVSGCGKQGLNVGDTVLLGIFVASVALLVSVFTAALRMTRRTND